jgi:protein lifeguard
MYETSIVLQALAITLAVFIGLTLFTFQSKYDFDGVSLASPVCLHAQR